MSVYYEAKGEKIKEEKNQKMRFGEDFEMKPAGSKPLPGAEIGSGNHVNNFICKNNGVVIDHYLYSFWSK